MPVMVLPGGTMWLNSSVGSTTTSFINLSITYNLATTGVATNYWPHQEPPDHNPASVARAREEARVREQQQRAEIAERRRIRARAGDRARSTLLSLLNAEQRAEYERSEQFVVQGSDGGRYRIRRGVAQNIEDLSVPYGNVLCAHPEMFLPEGQLPAEDAVIAQLLMLRFDEPGFLAVANRS